MDVGVPLYMGLLIVHFMPMFSSRLNSSRTKYTVSGASAVVWLCITSNGIPARIASSTHTLLSLPPDVVTTSGKPYACKLIAEAVCRRIIAVCSLSAIFYSPQIAIIFSSSAIVRYAFFTLTHYETSVLLPQWETPLSRLPRGMSLCR